MSIKIYDAYRVVKGHDPFQVLWKVKRVAQRRAKKRLTKIFDDILDGRSQEAHRRTVEQDAVFKTWLDQNGISLNENPYDLLGHYMRWVAKHCPPELKPAKDVLAVSDEEVMKAARQKPKEGAKPNVFDIDAFIRARYGETLTRRTRDFWALDTAVTMRSYQGRYYLIPYVDSASYFGGLLDFMKKETRLEEFGYWNNTDPPDHVSEQQWESRSKVWNELTDHSRWKEYVTLEIVSWLGWNNDVSPMMEVARARKEDR